MKVDIDNCFLLRLVWPKFLIIQPGPIFIFYDNIIKQDMYYLSQGKAILSLIIEVKIVIIFENI